MLRSSISIAPRSIALACVMLAALGATSCFDPEHSDEVNALGGEINGVGPGPLHRPGQACLVCHGGSGPGSPDFSVAGTIYVNRGENIPQAGALVTVTDVTKDVRSFRTNEAGNFYVSVDEWSPTFPVTVYVKPPDDLVAAQPKAGLSQMTSPIGRNGGCGFCHYGNDGAMDHMPPIYLVQPSKAP
jgi:hypothetical protein